MKPHAFRMPPVAAILVSIGQRVRKATAASSGRHPTRAPRRLGLKATMAASVIALLPAAGEPVRADEPEVEFGVNRAPHAFNDVCDDPRFVRTDGGGDAQFALRETSGLFGDAADCFREFTQGVIRLRTARETITEFGIGGDGGDWSGNGVCNDPRFVPAPGFPDAVRTVAGAEGQDASDCLAANLSRHAWPAGSGGVAFGNDSGEWASDGECDDPRFWGEAMAHRLHKDNLFGDATDCRKAFEAGSVKLITAELLRQLKPEALPGDEALGDDSSKWALDGECDDPRFEGEAMADGLVVGDRHRDATDCGRALLDGTATFRSFTKFELGGDSGDWSQNGVCNDPRFVPDPGFPDAVKTVAGAEGQDASDCLAANLSRHAWPVGSGGVAFGDDSGEWAFDGECDDPRFWGETMAHGLRRGNLFGDATDCREAFEAGSIRLFSVELLRQLKPDALPGDEALGDDSGEWAFDGECDDPRFGGDAMADGLQDEGMKHDATDCGKALLDGTVAIRAFTEFELGGDSGDWSGNGVCNDPRFVPDPDFPTAVDAVDGAEGQDASDCLTAYRTRQVWPAESDGVAFGDDSGDWAFDGECDDPRFWGEAMAAGFHKDNLFGDATDCRKAFESGSIRLFSIELLRQLKPDSLPGDEALGDDSSEWALDGECDDPRFEGEAMADELVEGDRHRDATDCGRALLNGRARFMPGAGTRRE